MTTIECNPTAEMIQGYSAGTPTTSTTDDDGNNL